MMKVLIKETGVKEELRLVDPKTGVDFVKDFVGNHGAFVDGQFTRVTESDAYECDQDTFDWWEQVIADHQALEYRIQELSSTHGSDRVAEVVNEASIRINDLEDVAVAVNRALDEEFGNA